MVAIAERFPMLRENVWRQIFAAMLFSCPQRLTLPTLFIASLKDRMVDSRSTKMLADKLSASAVESAPVSIKFHPTAGHDLPLDDPQWLIDRLREFEQDEKPELR
jgi:pimeloyl-ACP methyl ester carboxylesterase